MIFSKLHNKSTIYSIMQSEHTVKFFLKINIDVGLKNISA